MARGLAPPSPVLGQGWKRKAVDTRLLLMRGSSLVLPFLLLFAFISVSFASGGGAVDASDHVRLLNVDLGKLGQHRGGNLGSNDAVMMREIDMRVQDVDVGALGQAEQVGGGVAVTGSEAAAGVVAGSEDGDEGFAKSAPLSFNPEQMNFGNQSLCLPTVAPIDIRSTSSTEDVKVFSITSNNKAVGLYFQGKGGGGGGGGGYCAHSSANVSYSSSLYLYLYRSLSLYLPPPSP